MLKISNSMINEGLLYYSKAGSVRSAAEAGVEYPYAFDIRRRFVSVIL